MKEQIEHIAKVIHDSDIADINTFPISMSECLGKHGARRTGAAIAVVNAGYRKQSEGAWKRSARGKYDYFCTACGEKAVQGIYGNHDRLFKFCPNCGAKMKGGE